eukprot:SM000123S25823  [mRNA]  locus=s123:43268:47291:- [translate_table: standard]
MAAVLALAEAKTDAVPVHGDLQSVYEGVEDLAKARARYDAIATEFERLFGRPPQYFARAPGRVNLIGEHIDYEGYSVLPMAIRQDTVVAIGKADGTTASNALPLLTVANMNASKYPTVRYSVDPAQEVNSADHIWANYFLCGYKGVFEYLADQGQPHPPHSSLRVVVDGRVPTGAGLSSSAALVCSSAIAVMAALGLSASKSDVAEFTCKCERHIGTQSGGMDQAISVMARPGVAKLIDFNPIRATDVLLPEGGSFIIADSLTESNKAETAATNYNNRVVECRLAAMVLAAQLGMPVEQARTVKTLGDVESLCTATSESLELDGPIPAVEKTLHEAPYMREEIEKVLEASLQELFQESPTSLAVLKVAESFKLLQVSWSIYTALILSVHDRSILHYFAQYDHLHQSSVLETSSGKVTIAVLSQAVTVRCHALYCQQHVTWHFLSVGCSKNKRSVHVYSEARRVLQFKEVAATHQFGACDADVVLSRLGALMNESHHSCSTYYECSCPELEELVAICNANGALGARLTGAGWGGCTVSLVPDNQAASFIQALKDNYYAPRVKSWRIEASSLDACVFASKPASGAAVIRWS